MIQIKNHILGLPVITALMLAAACADNVDLDNRYQIPDENEKVVSLVIEPQKQNLIGGTRADGDFTISDGSHIDVIIFAVYSKGPEDKDFKLDPTFKKGEDKSITIKNNKITLGDGQNAYEISDPLKFFPKRLEFVVKDDYTYKVAFWAQSSECKAYDATVLSKVKVSYKDALNNDELRDAFCAVSDEFSVSDNKKTKPVILKRPFAQINVGTTGWDYEGAAVIKPKKTIYTQTSVEVSGIAQCYDVVNKKTVEDKTYPLLNNVKFNMNRLPALVNVADGISDIPSELGYLPGDKGNNEKFSEHFLYVKLDGTDEEPFKYWGWDEYNKFLDALLEEVRKDKDKSIEDILGVQPDTETFKYLSMCYVLVPEASELKDGPVSYGSVLTSLKVEIQGLLYNEEEKKFNKPSEKPMGLFPTVNNTITYVPVQKNWRTNILGNNFFTITTQVIVDVVPVYSGEYDKEGKDKEDGWLNITDRNPGDNGWVDAGGTANGDFKKDDDIK